MRIIKKEKVDVKRFMEEVKANRTHNSFASFEDRTTRPPAQEERLIGGLYNNFSKGSAQPYRQAYHQDFGYDPQRNYSSYSQFEAVPQQSQNYYPSPLPPQRYFGQISQTLNQSGYGMAPQNTHSFQFSNSNALRHSQTRPMVCLGERELNQSQVSRNHFSLPPSFDSDERTVKAYQAAEEETIAG
jgi:hypothetical protein